MNVPTEIKLDILQCLNYDQLFILQKTNGHFYNLINENERKLARMKFYFMEIVNFPNSERFDDDDEIIDQGVYEFVDFPFANLIKKAKFPSNEVKMKV
uniref:F-box domain-containing protein n=1 Tax=Meloidogyne hapla TaxID=6305 RepID=A0A1I8BR94_MELHA